MGHLIFTTPENKRLAIGSHAGLMSVDLHTIQVADVNRIRFVLRFFRLPIPISRNVDKERSKPQQESQIGKSRTSLMALARSLNDKRLENDFDKLNNSIMDHSCFNRVVRVIGRFKGTQLHVSDFNVGYDTSETLLVEPTQNGRCWSHPRGSDFNTEIAGRLVLENFLKGGMWLRFIQEACSNPPCGLFAHDREHVLFIGITSESVESFNEFLADHEDAEDDNNNNNNNNNKDDEDDDDEKEDPISSFGRFEVALTLEKIEDKDKDKSLER
ncbi:hypothetical protein V1478_012192 [Vespula squamosa]|uniref:Uncharacterized protein n=1 Tax=Vespula squamosa TaxID=30214 RepID=A0ABD2ACI0_VESSQ